MSADSDLLRRAFMTPQMPETQMIELDQNLKLATHRGPQGSAIGLVYRDASVVWFVIFTSRGKLIAGLFVGGVLRWGTPGVQGALAAAGGALVVA